MALTYTPEGQLGSVLPDFKLPTVEGRHLSSADLRKLSPLVILFICNHCPYVRAIEDRILNLSKAYADRIQFVGICSNDPAEAPEDSPGSLLKRWREKSYDFPYLIDEEQTVARAFGAVCTPDIYLYDQNQRLAYRGRLDDSWRDPARVQRQELKEALDRLLAHQPVSPVQNPSMGCSIKWKKGMTGR